MKQTPFTYLSGWKGKLYYASLFFALYAFILLHHPQGVAFAEETGQDLKWIYEIGGVTGSPVIDREGTLYVGKLTGLHALNSNGTQRWEFHTGGLVYPPVIGAGQTIYGASADGNVYAVTPEGQEVWRFTIDGAFQSSPVISDDGTLYMGSDNHQIYAIGPDGRLKWSFAAGAEIYTSPAVGSDGAIYFSSMDGKLYALQPDGTLKWQFTLSADTAYAAPVLGEDGTIYIGSDNGTFYAIRSDGEVKWSIPIGLPLATTAAVDQEGMIYLPSTYEAKLYKISPEGSIVWSRELHGRIFTAPLIDNEGTVYVSASNETKLHAFDPNGDKKREIGLEGTGRYSTPVIGGDGTLYIGGQEGLLAIGNRDPNLVALEVDKAEYQLSINQTDQLRVRAVYQDGTKVDITTAASLRSGNPEKVEINPYGVMEGIHTGSETITIGYEGLSRAIPVSVSVDTALFNPNLGQGGYQVGLYDLEAILPGPYNWTKQSRFTGPDQPVPLWGGPGALGVRLTPSVGKDGTIYIGGDDRMKAIHPDGTVKWTFEREGLTFGSPVIAEDGTLYVIMESRLYAINSDGQQQWAYDLDSSILTAFRKSIVLLADGTILLTDGRDRIHALNPDGTSKWIYQHDNTWGEEYNGISSNLAVGMDGTIYYGTDKGITAIHSEGIHKISLGLTGGAWGQVHSDTPSIGRDGTVYLGNTKGLYAFSSDLRTTKWFAEIESVVGSPAIRPNGMLYVGTLQGTLYAVAPEGKTAWKYAIGKEIYASPTIGADGTIYITAGNDLYAFSSYGELIWQYNQFIDSYGDVSASPVIGRDQTIYYMIGSGIQAIRNMKQTTINPFTNRDTTVTGTAEPGASIQVLQNSRLIAEKQAEEDGSFAIEIGQQATGTILEVTASYRISSQHVWMRKNEIAVASVTLQAPVVNRIQAGETTVTGSAAEGDRIVVRKAEQLLGTNTILADRSFAVAINSQQAGETLEIYAEDHVGNRSSPVYQTVERAPIVISIPDVNLEASIRAKLNIADREITDMDMEQLFMLEVANQGITDLSGLEYAAQLWFLDISRNQIRNLAPLENLDSLRELWASYNQIEDISILGTLDNLETLIMSDNQLRDISALKDLIHLNYVDIMRNPMDLSLGSPALEIVAVLDTRCILNMDVPQPSADLLTEDDTLVTGKMYKGTYEPWVEVRKGDQVLASVQVREDGTFSLQIPKQSVGTSLHIAAEIAGYRSKETIITVKRAAAKYDLNHDGRIDIYDIKQAAYEGRTLKPYLDFYGMTP